VDNEAWRGEIPLIEDHFAFIGEYLPSEMRDELGELEKRLSE
jgi:phosphoenolpyruvate carboxykinase (GTP)